MRGPHWDPGRQQGYSREQQHSCSCRRVGTHPVPAQSMPGHMSNPTIQGGHNPSTYTAQRTVTAWSVGRTAALAAPACAVVAVAGGRGRGGVRRERACPQLQPCVWQQGGAGRCRGACFGRAGREVVAGRCAEGRQQDVEERCVGQHVRRLSTTLGSNQVRKCP